MTETLQDLTEEIAAQDAAGIFAQWLSGFTAAVQSGSASDLSALFLQDATWRDFMAFPWDFHHTVGRDETVERLLEMAGEYSRYAELMEARERPREQAFG